MIINMSGGGIDNLKFRVYAATSLPASGKENDVCIITSTPISGWEVYPNSPAWESGNGHVYIQNDPAYSGEYPNVNILKKNAIWLYLIKCWQYENGTWSAKGAYQYRNGAWVQFSTVFRATINITYPAGSTCKATCGSTTLTAPNTSGIWACVVPNAGTWTVTATNGSDSKSETAEITTDGQSVSVSIDYGFDLYKAGDECLAVTGGWVTGSTGKGTHSVQKLDSGMHIKCVQGDSDVSDDVGVRTSSKVDLTGYSQLTIQYRIITRSYKLSLKVGTSTAVATSNSNSYNAILDLNGNPGNYEKTLPINFSTQMYIGVCTHCTYGSPTSEFVVERVFLR